MGIQGEDNHRRILTKGSETGLGASQGFLCQRGFGDILQGNEVAGLATVAFQRQCLGPKQPAVPRRA